MVMNTYIYGTFEKESQWRGASLSSGRNHTDYIYVYMYITLDITLDPKFDVESNGMWSVRAQSGA